jgi:hypothetical protein
MSRNYYSEINLHFTWHCRGSAPILTPQIEPVAHRIIKARLTDTPDVSVPQGYGKMLAILRILTHVLFPVLLLSYGRIGYSGNVFFEVRTATMNGDISAIAYSPDGRHIACGTIGQNKSRNGLLSSVSIYDVALDRSELIMTVEDSEVLSIAFAPCGKRLVLFMSRGTICSWNVVSHMREWTYHWSAPKTANGQLVISETNATIKFSPGGKYVFATGLGAKILRLTAAAGNSATEAEYEQLQPLEFSGSGSSVRGMTPTGIITEQRFADGLLLFKRVAVRSKFAATPFRGIVAHRLDSENGLLALEDFNALWLVDFGSGRMVCELEHDRGARFSDVCFFGGGKYVAACMPRDNQPNLVKVWSVPDGKVQFERVLAVDRGDPHVINSPTVSEFATTDGASIRVFRLK